MSVSGVGTPSGQGASLQGTILELGDKVRALGDERVQDKMDGGAGGEELLRYVAERMAECSSLLGRGHDPGLEELGELLAQRLVLLASFQLARGGDMKAIEGIVRKLPPEQQRCVRKETLDFFAKALLKHDVKKDGDEITKLATMGLRFADSDLCDPSLTTRSRLDGSQVDLRQLCRSHLEAVA